MGMNAGSHHLTTLFLSRQFQPNNLPVYKLCETVPTQPMWSNPDIKLLIQTTGLHQGCHAVRIWELMQVRSISLLYFKQAIATKQPDSIQTETMQPMWCNPNISTYLFNTTGLHEGWEKNMQLEYGNEFRFAPSHNFVSKQAISTKQPASIQVVRNCETHVVKPKHATFACYGFASRLEESHAVRIWELMQLHLTA